MLQLVPLFPLSLPQNTHERECLKISLRILGEWRKRRTKTNKTAAVFFCQRFPFTGNTPTSSMGVCGADLQPMSHQFRMFVLSLSLCTANSHATPSAVLNFNIFASPRSLFLLFVHRLRNQFSYVTMLVDSAGSCAAFSSASAEHRMCRGRKDKQKRLGTEIERKIGAQTAAANAT